MRKSSAKSLVSGAVALVAALAFAAPAGAAEGDPLTIEPTEVEAGQSFSVSAGDCDGLALVAVVPPGAEDETDVVAVASENPDEAGDWETSIEIPVGTAPGEYDVYARCSGSYDGYEGYNGAMASTRALGDTFDYAPATITVVSGPAVVVDDPDVEETTGGGSGGGSLPNTGAGILALLAVGATLAGGSKAVSTYNKRRQSA